MATRKSGASIPGVEKTPGVATPEPKNNAEKIGARLRAQSATAQEQITPSPTDKVETKEEEYDYAKQWNTLPERFRNDIITDVGQYANKTFIENFNKKYDSLIPLINAYETDPNARKALDKLSKDEDVRKELLSMLGDDEELDFIRSSALPTWREQDPTGQGRDPEVIRLRKEIESERRAREESQTKAQRENEEKVKREQYQARRINELIALQSETGDRLKFDNTQAGYEKTKPARLASYILEMADYFEQRDGRQYNLKDIYDVYIDLAGTPPPAAPATTRGATLGTPQAAPTSAATSQSGKARVAEKIKAAGGLEAFAKAIARS